MAFTQIIFEDSGQELGNNKDFHLKLADIDNDGDIDAIEGGRIYSIRLNDGNGKFTLSQTINGNGNLDVADLDGDTYLDLFLSGDTGDSNRVWLNNKKGVFVSTHQLLGDISYSSRDVALGDLDGDNDIDAFVANHDNPSTPIDDGDNWVFFNDGNGFFTISEQAKLGNDWCNNINLGDIDKDGDLDAIVANNTYKFNKGHEVWINDGNGIFKRDSNILDSLAGNIELKDFDNDTDLDIFISYSDYRYNILDSCILFINDGTGTFTPGQKFKNLKGDYCIGDINNDNFIDVLLDSLWLNNGNGTFSNAGALITIIEKIPTALKDLDGDGDLDAYIINDGPNKVYINKTQSKIENKLLNNIFKIYPNPVQNTLQIECPGLLQTETNYKIIDLTGKTLQEGKLTGNTVDVSQISKGTYILNLDINEENLNQKFIIK